MHTILLIITGSIAAIKSLELIRLLKEANINVTCVLTKAGEEFITPMSCAVLSGNTVRTQLFDTEAEMTMGHIHLARHADMVVVAPASADFIHKMAHGGCDDLASTLVLANTHPILVAPAMNGAMWQHPATQRNITQIKQDGVIVIEPTNGMLACGEIGQGRMVEPKTLLTEIQAILDRRNHHHQPLFGKKAIVTTGATREHIDPVRYISNHSSGKQGMAIAEALRDAGAEVTIISGITHLDDPANTTIIKVESAKEMYHATMQALPADIAICCAAVADWAVVNPSLQKIKKTSEQNLELNFEENPDILYNLSHHPTQRPQLVIGFAAESEHLIEHATKKRLKKGCDWMIANDISGRKIFNSDENTVVFISHDTLEHWEKLSKQHVGNKIVDKIIKEFSNR